MSRRTEVVKTSRVVDAEPAIEGIECTPEGLAKTVAGCFGFLLSVLMVVSLGLTATGIFWTAQSLQRVSTHIEFGVPPSGSAAAPPPPNGQYMLVQQRNVMDFISMVCCHLNGQDGITYPGCDSLVNGYGNGGNTVCASLVN